MLRKTLFSALLVFLAWCLKDVLEVVLPLPTESMVEGFLDLEKNGQYAVFKLLRYIVWIIVLFLVIKFARPLLRTVLPFSQKFSTTRRIRRIQGLVVELFIFGTVFLIWGIWIAIRPAYSTYNQNTEHHKQRIEASIDSAYVSDQLKLKDTIEDNRSKALYFVITHENEYIIPNGIWPMEPSRTIKEYSKTKELSYRNKFKQRRVSTEKKDIRQSKAYERSFLAQKKTFRQLKNSEAAYRRNKARLNRKARQANRTELGNPVLFAVSTPKKKWWLVIGLSLLIYFLIDRFLRSGFGKWYEKMLSFFEQGRFGKGGSARFAGIFEEWGLLFNRQKQGLFMGRSLYSPFRDIGLDDPRHMLTIAATRSGKGTSAIIPNLLLWEGSALVIDPKGTNAIVTKRRREEMGQDVHLIDPFGITGQQTASVNVLATFDPDSETIREDILRIAEAMVIYEENQDHHWSDGSKTVIGGLIAHLITSPKYTNPNLTMLRDMISMLPEPQAELWVEMSFNEKAGKLAKDAANRIIRGIATDEITNILSNADKQTEWLTSSVMKKILETSSFNFSDLKEKPTTVYLILPPNELRTHNRFLRLFINLALNQMSIGGRAKVPVLMLLDEFLALRRMQAVEEAFPLLAGYNFVMWPFIQNLESLKKIYGRGADTFLSNSRAIQVFGVDGGATKEFVSKHIGHIAPKSLKGRTVALRTPSEVAIDISAQSGRQYILRAGRPPLVLEKVRYYKGAPIKMLSWIPFFGKIRKGRFAGKYDPDPDYT